jgi:hypothetical protein
LSYLLVCRVLAAKKQEFECALVAVVRLARGSTGFLSKALFSEATNELAIQSARNGKIQLQVPMLDPAASIFSTEYA